MQKIRIAAAAGLFLFVIPATLAHIGRSIDHYLFPSLSLGGAWLLGVPVIMAGFLASTTSISQLYTYGAGMPWGDISSDAQSSKMVTGGIYRYSRNPMLFGFGLFILGAGIFCESFTMAFILSVLLVDLVSIWIKKREEPMLLKRFGREYSEYRRRTSFLIPWKPRE